MIATAITLAILWFAGSMLAELFRENRGKMLAALEGRSWTANASATPRPIAVRFSLPCKAAGPAPWPALSAAA